MQVSFISNGQTLAKTYELKCQSCHHVYLAPTKSSKRVCDLCKNAVVCIGEIEFETRIQIQPLIMGDFITEQPRNEIRQLSNTKIPEQIMDLQKHLNGMLVLTTKQQDLFVSPKIRVWNSPVVTDRIMPKKNLTYVERNMNEINYDKNKPEITYLNFANGITDYEATLKIAIENGIHFNADNLDITQIYYDIETKKTEGSDFPNYKNPHDFTAMIGSVWISKNRPILFRLYSLDRYHYSQSQIEERAQQELTKLKLDYDITVEICKFSCETEMCIQFFRDVRIVGKSALIGFNSSSSTKDNEKGFDLPWLINRTTWSIKEEMAFGVKLFGTIGHQIKSIDILPDCFVLDAQVIFHNHTYFQTKAKDRVGFKLNHFLDQVRINKEPINLKYENDFEKMNNLFVTPNSNCTEIASYCLYDCFSLYLTLEHCLDYFNSVKINVSMFDCPLSWVLYKTPAQWLTFSALRRAYDVCDLAFQYKRFDNVKQEYIGATTEECPKEFRNKVLGLVAMFDYQSLYPNSILAGNLGIDSVTNSDDKNSYKIDLNFVDPFMVAQSQKQLQEQVEAVQLGKPYPKIKKVYTELPKQFVYFTKTPSKMLQPIADALALRLEIKKQMNDKNITPEQRKQLDAKQQSVKILVNTIYGLSGSTRYQLFNLDCARACTSIARQMCYQARKSIEDLKLGQIVFRDTDSCAIMLENADNLLQTEKALNTHINTHSAFSHYPFKFVLETDDIQVKTYYPEAKKAYIRIKTKLENINKPQFHQLEMKGVSWSLFTEHTKAEFKTFTHQLMLETSKTSIHEQVQNYQKQLTDKIKSQENNQYELALQYGTRLKYSKNNDKCKFIQKRYHITPSTTIILPIQSNESNKLNECIVPIEILKRQSETQDYTYRIDLHRVIKHAISPITKFFGNQEIEQKYIQQTEQIDSNIIKLKQAYAIGYSAEILNIEINKVTDLVMRKQNISFNEVIYKPRNKIFFDIDDCKLEINFYKILTQIKYWINKMANNFIEDIIIKYTKSTTKNQSYHIICDCEADLACNAFIGRQINLQLGFNCVDIGVYSLNKCLRVPFSPKYDEKTKQIVQSIHKPMNPEWILTDFLFSNSQDCSIIIPDSLIFDDQMPRQIPDFRLSITKSDHDLIRQKLGLPCVFKESLGKCLQIEIQQKPYECPVCSCIHTSDNLYSWKTQETIMIKCYSASQRKKDDVAIKPLQIKYQADALVKESRETKNLKYYQEILKACQNMKIDLSNIPQELIQFQNQPEVEFDLNQKITFVKSAMGTGKTKCQMRLLSETEYKFQLAFAFRRTFSRDSAMKNQMENYEDQESKREFSLLQTPKLIIQVDSLCRYQPHQQPDILIIDEVESILEQLLSIKRTSTNYMLKQFINLLRNSKQILVMDAHLEPKTIQVLSQLAGCDNYKVFINEYQNKIDHRIIVKDFSNLAVEEKTLMVGDILHQLEIKQKTAVFCTGSTFAETIYKTAKQRFPHINIKLYTGADTGQNEQGMSMAKQKRQDFENVNESWSELDLLIYTGTLTAGISFEIKHFDTLFAIYVQQTCSPNSFTQGLHRIRNISTKTIKLYLQKYNDNELCTPKAITEREHQLYSRHGVLAGVDLSSVSQLSVWLQAGMNQQNSYRIPFVFKNLEQAGYQFEFAKITNSDAGNDNEIEQTFKDATKHKIQVIVDAQITNEDMTKIPAILKSTQKMIDNTDPDLQAKFEKVKLAKNYNLTPAQANQLDFSMIKELLGKQNDHRGRRYFANQVEIANETLNIDLSQLSSEQISITVQTIAKQIEFQQQAQSIETTSKKQRGKFVEQCHMTTVGLKIKNYLQEHGLSTDSVKSARQFIHEDAILKQMGIMGKSKSAHKDLNRFLVYIDQELITTGISKRERNQEGQQVREYNYDLINCGMDLMISDYYNRINSLQAAQQ